MDGKHLTKDDKSFDQSLPRVRHPRPVWQELILFLFSFTIYASFWLVGRVRDLKAVSNKDFTPWLWFFIPLVPLLQMAALPRFFKELKRIEQGSTTRNWKAFTWLWITVLVITNIVIFLEDQLDLSAWALTVGVIIISLLFTLLHQRINKWKKGLSSVKYYGKASGYTWYEWLFVSVGVLLSVLILYFYVIAPIFEKIQSLENLQIIEDSDLGYQLTISGDGWVEVISGTHSSDETELELSGPVLNSFFIVYDQGISNTINSIARNRAELRDDFSDDPECTEDRFLSDDEKSVISYTECNGTELGDMSTTYSTIIKSKDRHIELFGYLSAPKYAYARQSKNMKNIAQSFSPK